PAIFLVTNNGVNAACTNSNVQTLYLVSCRDVTLIRFSQQIGSIMYVIGPTRYRWCEVVLRNIPYFDTVKMHKQGFVQHFYSLRVKKIYRSILVLIQPDKR